MKCLIVDDSEDFRLVIRSSLVRFCAEIEECSDGDEALVLCLQTRPDLILMDIRLKRMNGLVATREIMQRDHTAKVIILTSLDDDDLRREALAAGASGYVLKENLHDLRQVILSLS